MNVEDIVVTELARFCGLEKSEIVRDSWLAEFGIDSVRRIEIVISLEDALDILVDDEDLERVVKVGDVIDLAEEKIAKRDQHGTTAKE